MATLSDKLADLSVRVGDIEARAEAFVSAQQGIRDRKVDEMKAELQARQVSLQARARSAGDEISNAWSTFNQSMHDRVEMIQLQIGAKKDAIDAKPAVARADRLERNALLALDFAFVAMADAELAVAEALDARLRAADFVLDDS